MAALPPPLPGLAKDVADLVELGRGTEAEEWGERSPNESRAVFWVNSWHSLPVRCAERRSELPWLGPPGLAS